MWIRTVPTAPTALPFFLVTRIHLCCGGFIWNQVVPDLMVCPPPHGSHFVLSCTHYGSCFVTGTHITLFSKCVHWCKKGWWPEKTLKLNFWYFMGPFQQWLPTSIQNRFLCPQQLSSLSHSLIALIHPKTASGRFLKDFHSLPGLVVGNERYNWVAYVLFPFCTATYLEVSVCKPYLKQF